MRSLHKSLRVFVTAAALAAAASTAGAMPVPPPDEDIVANWQDAYTRAVLPGEQADFHRELLVSLVRRVKRSHAMEVDLGAVAGAATKYLGDLPPQAGDPQEVFRRSVNAALRTLDPQSRYLDARTHANERSASSGSFGGIGIEVEPGARSLRILNVVADAPAARAGLLAGDVIVRVDGNAVDGVPVQDTLEKLRGAPGTQLSLTVERGPAKAEHTFPLTRDTIRRQVLRTAMEGDVLVLKLSGFSGPVSTSVAAAINAAADQKPRALVLDLRGNPGGLLREAIRLADTFLAKGDIVSERGSNNPGRYRTWAADEEELAAGLPMVVLLDKGSASASELVADALQFHGRATVMGQQSYGKGSVQTTFSLGEGKGAVKLTTSLYHGPSGKTLHRVGVTPDLEIATATKAAARTAVDRPDVPVTDVREAGKAKARIDPARCAALKPGDPELSCALDYLAADSLDKFAAKTAE